MVELEDINLDSLLEFQFEGKLDQVFLNTLKQVETEIGFKPVVSKVNIVYNGQAGEGTQKDDANIDIGITRVEENGTLTLILSEKYKEFLPFILLREVFYCFLPPKIKEIRNTKIAVNFLVEVRLNHLKNIKEWKVKIRETIYMDHRFDSGFEREMSNLFNLEGDSNTNPLKIFFEYFRNTTPIKDQDPMDFFDDILHNFYLKTSRILFRDDLIETLRILITIFYKVKNYRALSEYQEYFKQLKETGNIKTDLSLKRFSSNVQWIARNKWIAPNYQYNYPALGLKVIWYDLIFNPLLPAHKILHVLERTPFLFLLRYSLSNFAVTVSGYFLTPYQYTKDVLSFLDKIEQQGYVIKKDIYNWLPPTGNELNLNYFREFYKTGRIVNPFHKQYDEKYEVSYRRKDITLSPSPLKKFSTLEYLFLSIAGYFATSGLGFERTSETIKTLKDSLFAAILRQKNEISKLKRTAEKLIDTIEYKEEFSRLLVKFYKKGIFSLRNFIHDFTICLTLVIRHLKKHPHVTALPHLQKELAAHTITSSFEDELVFNNTQITKPIFTMVSSSTFEELKEVKNRFQVFETFIKLCSSMKIFDLAVIAKLVDDTTLVAKILRDKQAKLDTLRGEFKALRSITSNDLDTVINFLVNTNPPVIDPILITSMAVTPFAGYYFQIFIKDYEGIEKEINTLKRYIPRVVHSLMGNSSLGIRKIGFYLPYITTKEKYLFISILVTLFKGRIILGTRFFESGFFKGFFFRDFYDLDKHEFFYAPDLFSQYFLYVQNILGDPIKKRKLDKGENRNLFWNDTCTCDLDELVSQVEKRKSWEDIDFTLPALNELVGFYESLESYLLDTESFRHIKKSEFFIRHVKAIKFKPAFQKFGMGQYYLYINTPHLSNLDFKLLFNNIFQKVWHPLHPLDVQSLFIRYIFPFKNPNMAYINLLALHRKMISEYCMFFVKKMHVLCHFERSLGPKGWNIDAKNFRSFVRRNLHNSKLTMSDVVVKSYTLGNMDTSTYLSPNSQDFHDLKELYGCKGKDIKLILGTNRKNLSNTVLNLLKKKLIVPYLKLKNLNFMEKLVIILPDLFPEVTQKVIRAFSFFNYGFIYEIEGQYFIQGLDEEKKFQNGIMIKLYLPPLELSPFQTQFKELFHYLGIEKYLIINDLYEAKKLLQSVYGDSDVFKSYNPLKNLKWNTQTKVYNNPKLFGEGVTPIYPKLIPDDDE